MPPDRSIVQPWLQAETTRLLATVDTFWDSNLADDSSLPGWSLGHLLSHIARNADALCNLLSWARTGVETPMYQSMRQRNDDIEFGAVRPGSVIFTDVVDSAARLQIAIDELAEADWSHEVVTAQGRTITADTVPWLRLREVTVHRVDLGGSFEDLPPDLVVALLDNTVSIARSKPGWPSLRLVPTDGAQVAEFGSGPIVVVTGTPSQLLAWLTGRSTGRGLIASSDSLPPLPAWL